MPDGGLTLPEGKRSVEAVQSRECETQSDCEM